MRVPATLACTFILLMPAAASAQQSSSRLWITAGAAWAAQRGDCQECEEDFPYRNATSITGNGGYRVNDRMDVGADILWVPIDTSAGRIKTTHFDAIAQFRPWSSKGFFLKGGAGMAFVRNWVDAVGPDAINSKALSVVIGGGWAFRRDQKVGVQVFATQHVAALGDLQSAGTTYADVTGNLWSLGASVVFR
jgi:hypothetical protein